MKIKHFAVTGLNKKIDFSFDFHSDINILTGINGSGKTTALKLAWYLVSGNTIKIRTEISFRTCRIVTDSFEVNLEREGSRNIRYTFSAGDVSQEGAFDDMEHDGDGDPIMDGEDMLRDLIREVSDQSLYFPTFRRIEGGYSITARRGRFAPRLMGASPSDIDLSAQLEQISKMLSAGHHKFVCSISTEDIAALLTERYAVVSEGLNSKYTEFSSDILERIRAWEQGGENSRDQSDQLLLRIQATANDIDGFRDATLKPFNVLSNLVANLFNYQGVKVKGLALGDAAKAIDSDILSAGEKQMLSFLVYNAFAINTPIFIDEPELSLHPDWQRKLFPTLLEQQASNQFIISSHSPFIYAKYGDKELRLSPERGD